MKPSEVPKSACRTLVLFLREFGLADKPQPAETYSFPSFSERKGQTSAQVTLKAGEAQFVHLHCVRRDYYELSAPLCKCPPHPGSPLSATAHFQSTNPLLYCLYQLIQPRRPCARQSHGSLLASPQPGYKLKCKIKRSAIGRAGPACQAIPTLVSHSPRAYTSVSLCSVRIQPGCTFLKKIVSCQNQLTANTLAALEPVCLSLTLCDS